MLSASLPSRTNTEIKLDLRVDANIDVCLYPEMPDQDQSSNTDRYRVPEYSPYPVLAYLVTPKVP